MKKIPGIDKSKALEQHDGSQVKYLKVLRSYMVSTKTKLGLLEKIVFDKDNLKQYEIAIHGIKGTSRGICAEELGNKAAELEKAAVAGDIDFIKRNNPFFLKAAWELIRSLEEMFKSIDSKIVTQKKDRPDKEVLIKLKEACEIFDMQEIEAAITELTKYQYDFDNDLVEYLHAKAEEMKYDEIAEKLSAL